MGIKPNETVVSSKTTGKDNQSVGLIECPHNDGEDYRPDPRVLRSKILAALDFGVWGKIRLTSKAGRPIECADGRLGYRALGFSHPQGRKAQFFLGSRLCLALYRNLRPAPVRKSARLSRRGPENAEIAQAFDISPSAATSGSNKVNTKLAVPCNGMNWYFSCTPVNGNEFGPE